MTPIEEQRIREATALMGHLTTVQWRDYFAYLLGRPVTLAETDTLLRSTGKPVLQEV